MVSLHCSIRIQRLILYQYLPEGEELRALQTGCFKYFELGGEMVNGPVTLLAGYVASGVC